MKAESLKVPEGVSPHLRRELQSCQDKITTLVKNYAVIKKRLITDPGNPQHEKRLKRIKILIADVNDKQRPLLTSIRKEIEELPTIEEKDESEGQNEEAAKPEATNGESAEPKNIGERMALVRQNKKRRKRRRFHPPRPTRSPSPKVTEEGHWSLEVAPELPEGQFIAETSEMEVIEYSAEERARLDVTSRMAVADPVTPMEVVNSPKLTKDAFLLNLGLVSPKEFDSIVKYRKDIKKTKNEVRNKLYIPEFTEKKQRETYNWLGGGADVTSPPLLRTRQRRSNSDLNTNSNNEKAASTPDQSVANGRTRRHQPPPQQQPDSEPSEPAASSPPSAPISRTPTPPPMVMALTPPSEVAEMSSMPLEEEVRDEIDNEEMDLGGGNVIEQTHQQYQQQQQEIRALEDQTDSDFEPLPREETVISPPKKTSPPKINTTPPPRQRPERSRKSRYGVPRSALSADLAKCEARYAEVIQILGDNKFTVATRKERAKLNEIQTEKVELEAKIENLKRLLDRDVV